MTIMPSGWLSGKPPSLIDENCNVLN